ncbi:MAG: HEPN domain-containing protein [Patescibacteria group bacterium]|nr:HEPN domain-containing protein [Patescibacteria group bacterium]
MNKKIYEQALKDRRLVKFPEGIKLVNQELKVAKADLKTAGQSLLKKDYKWATVQGYYAIFHSARALIYSRKIKEKTHYHLAVAIKVLFVDEYLLSEDLLMELREAMGLREKSDYESEYSVEGAKYVISVAKDFIKAAVEILN